LPSIFSHSQCIELRWCFFEIKNKQLEYLDSAADFKPAEIRIIDALINEGRVEVCEGKFGGDKKPGLP